MSLNNPKPTGKFCGSVGSLYNWSSSYQVPTYLSSMKSMFLLLYYVLDSLFFAVYSRLLFTQWHEEPPSDALFTKARLHEFPSFGNYLSGYQTSDWQAVKAPLSSLLYLIPSCSLDVFVCLFVIRSLFCRQSCVGFWKSWQANPNVLCIKWWRIKMFQSAYYYGVMYINMCTWK